MEPWILAIRGVPENRNGFQKGSEPWARRWFRMNAFKGKKYVTKSPPKSVSPELNIFIKNIRLMEINKPTWRSSHFFCLKNIIF